MVETTNVKFEFDADQALEAMGYALTDKANELFEEGRETKMARSLHTIGREMIEDARSEKKSKLTKSVEDEAEVNFEDTLYDV